MSRARAWSRSWVLAAVLLPGALYGTAARAACKQRGDRPQIFVKAKTAIRRGPGLNFQPSSILDDGRCVAMSEVSVDELWVLIEDEEKKLFGWVPASALDSAGRELARSASKRDTPRGATGSGGERGYVVAKASSSLLARPDPDAEVKKVLPSGARLLALSITADGKWVEVRDDRGELGWIGTRGLVDDGDTLSNLPKAGGAPAAASEPAGSSGGAASKRAGASPSGTTAGGGGKGDSSKPAGPADPPGPREDLVPAAGEPGLGTSTGASGEVAGPTATGLEIEARVLALGSLPNHELDSNGTLGIRRYTVSSFSAGGHVEMIAGPIGDVRVRLGYSFVLLSGLETAAANGQASPLTLSGQEHDATLIFGYPIELGALTFTPEGGYAFSLYAMSPTLPGSNVPQFFSLHSHTGRVGAALELDVTEELRLEVDAAALVGTTIEYPFDLGGAGLTIGAAGGAGVRFALAAGLAALLRWDLSYRRAPYSGAAQIDPTITEASLTRFGNGFSAGVALTL